MPRSTGLLGIDIGTSGCKSLLITPDGETVAEHSSAYPNDMPCPLWSEQDPDRWWSATIECLRAIGGIARQRSIEISGIGLTGQMHGLVLLDRHGEVLRPAILWNDQRTTAECAEITARVGAARIIQLTGNPVLTGFTAPKIEWVRKHEPAVFAAIAHVLLPKDFIRFRLSGALFGDVSDASGTSLFDVGQRAWSPEMLTALDTPRAWLPEITESPVASTALSADAAAQTGLPAGIPIIAGAGDQAAQAIGTGIVAEGSASITVGTSGVVFAASRSCRVDPAGRLHAFCHAVPGQWHLMGVMLSAGGSFEWLCDVLSPAGRDGAQYVHEELLALAANAPAASDGLIYLPYLTGERTPHADALARGAFIGLTARHTRAHIVRSVLEGVCFGLRDSVEIMRGLDVSIGSVRGSGGGLRSPVWRQILADVLGRPIESVNTDQGAAFGAALLAGVGAGIFPDVAAACRACVRTVGSTAVTNAVDVYEQSYRRFQGLYPSLRCHFHALTDG